MTDGRSERVAVSKEDLQRRVDGTPWYHTIELPGGIVTPGRWDTRRAAKRLPVPKSLAGKRCLDVGTWDGFWAFEMERRGASEVVAVDLQDGSRWDWPASTPKSTIAKWQAGVAEYPGFRIVHEALGSRVERIELSVYEISPERLGQFDFVFIGSLLMHLRDPVRALSALRSVVRGELLSADSVSLTLSLVRPFRPAADLDGCGAPHWWTPNMAARKRLLVTAGYKVLRSGGPYVLRSGPGGPRPTGGFRSRFAALIGVPHTWILAAPAAPAD